MKDFNIYVQIFCEFKFYFIGKIIQKISGELFVNSIFKNKMYILSMVYYWILLYVLLIYVFIFVQYFIVFNFVGLYKLFIFYKRLSQDNFYVIRNKYFGSECF